MSKRIILDKVTEGELPDIPVIEEVRQIRFTRDMTIINSVEDDSWLMVQQGSEEAKPSVITFADIVNSLAGESGEGVKKFITGDYFFKIIGDISTLETLSIENVTSAINSVKKELDAEVSRSSEVDKDHEARITSNRQSIDYNANRLTEEINRAKKEEEAIKQEHKADKEAQAERDEAQDKALESEVTRAKAAEKAITDTHAADKLTQAARDKAQDEALASEVSRAKAAEKAITDAHAADKITQAERDDAQDQAIEAEMTRAKEEEAAIRAEHAKDKAAQATRDNTQDQNLKTETERAQAAEKKNADAITAEKTRATTEEARISTNLQTETERAIASEEALGVRVDTEKTRAEAAEKKNADAIDAEKTRATTRENELKKQIDDNYAYSDVVFAELDGKIIDEYVRATREEQAIDAKYNDWCNNLDGWLTSVDSVSHQQNTDTGTDKTSFQINSGKSGGRVKSEGTGLSVRNAADNAYAPLIVNDLTIKGNVVQEGDSFITNSQTVKVSDNTMTLNNGEVGAGVTSGFAGLEIDRGTLPKYNIYFDESDDRFKVGTDGSMMCIALRDSDADMSGNEFVQWDATTKSLKTGNKTSTGIILVGTDSNDNVHLANGDNSLSIAYSAQGSQAGTTVKLSYGAAQKTLSLITGGVTFDLPSTTLLSGEKIATQNHVAQGFLPLTAGSGKPLTGMLYADKDIRLASNGNIYVNNGGANLAMLSFGISRDHDFSIGPKEAVNKAVSMTVNADEIIGNGTSSSTTNIGKSDKRFNEVYATIGDFYTSVKSSFISSSGNVEAGDSIYMKNGAMVFGSSASTGNVLVRQGTFLWNKYNNASGGFIVGKLLVSDDASTAESNKVPNNGIYTKGVIFSNVGLYVQKNRVTDINFTMTSENYMTEHLASFTNSTTNAPGTDPYGSGSLVNDGFTKTYFWNGDFAVQLAFDIDGAGIAYRGYTPSTSANKTGWKFLADTKFVSSKYLPLTAGEGKALTGTLYANVGINIPNDTGVRFHNGSSYVSGLHSLSGALYLGKNWNTVNIGNASGNVNIPAATTFSKGITTSHGTSYVYDNVISTYIPNTVTGTLKITLPQSWTGTMLTFEIDIYNYQTNSNSKYIVSGYNYASETRWNNTGCALIGNKVGDVRLAHDGTKCCILIGTTASKWIISNITISKVIAHYSKYSSWATGYSISVISDETGIDSIVTPVINGTGLLSKNIPVVFTSNDTQQLYVRNLGVNNATWSFASFTNGTTTSIYAPTSAGKSGQILASTGATPSWIDKSTITADYLPLTAGKSKSLSDVLYASRGVYIGNQESIRFYYNGRYNIAIYSNDDMLNIGGGYEVISIGMYDGLSGLAIDKSGGNFSGSVTAIGDIHTYGSVKTNTIDLATNSSSSNFKTGLSATADTISIGTGFTKASIPCSDIDITGITRFHKGQQTFGNNSVVYDNVFTEYHTQGEKVGTLKIQLPNSWTSTMLRFEIDIFNYNTTTPTSKYIISGYNYVGSGTPPIPRWVDSGCELTGKYKGDVRLAHDGEKCCILIGTTTSQWNHVNVSITKVIASYNNTDIWGEGYTISLLTDETGITGIYNLNINGSGLISKNLPVVYSSAGERLYERTLGINGTSWGFTSFYNLSSTIIYAPTTAGTSGQILQSTGGTPAWVNLSTITGNYLPLSGGTVTGKLTTDTLTIGNTTTVSHLSFSRGGYNYITAPTGGYIGFVANGKSISAANCDLLVWDKQVFPGTANAVDLGLNAYRWKTVYATKFSGALEFESLDDINNATMGRIFTSSSGTAANTPTSYWASGITLGPNNDTEHKHQIAFGGLGASVDLYIRSLYRGAWGSWRAVATQDWVTSQGYQSNALTQVQGDARYLKLSGGNMTGAISLVKGNDCLYGDGTSWNDGYPVLGIQARKDTGAIPIIAIRNEGAAINVTGSDRLVSLDYAVAQKLLRLHMNGVRVASINNDSITVFSKTGISPVIVDSESTIESSVRISRSGTPKAAYGHYTNLGVYMYSYPRSKYLFIPDSVDEVRYGINSNYVVLANTTWADNKFALKSIYTSIGGYADIRSAGNEICIGSAVSATTMNVNYRASSAGYTPSAWYWRAGSSSSYAAGYWGNLYSYKKLVATQEWVTNKGYLTNNYSNPIFTSGIKLHVGVTGGWARVLWIGNKLDTTTTGVVFGGYGQDDVPNYAYIGAGESQGYSAINNLKVYVDKVTFANKTLATVDQIPSLSGYATQTWVTQQGYLTSVPAQSWASITGKPTFATVATSGSYNDLTNKPTIPSAYTLPVATSSALGGIRIGYTASGKTYPVLLNSSNQAYVSVPWTDTNTTYAQATASALGLVKIGATDLAAKQYAVQLNSSGQMFVAVPWSDANTHYITRIYAGASGTAANAVATNPYIKVTDDNTYRNQLRLVGAGGTTIASDASGNITITSANTTYGIASATVAGLVKPISVITKPTLQSATTTSGRYYSVQMSSDGNMFVNVPWSDTNTTYGLASTTANGLLAKLSGSTTQFLRGDGTWAALTTATSSVLGAVKIGSNITVSSGTISVLSDNVTNALGFTPIKSTSTTKVVDIQVVDTIPPSASQVDGVMYVRFI